MPASSQYWLYKGTEIQVISLDEDESVVTRAGLLDKNFN
jgi:hypothetical protein